MPKYVVYLLTPQNGVCPVSSRRLALLPRASQHGMIRACLGVSQALQPASTCGLTRASLRTPPRDCDCDFNTQIKGGDECARRQTRGLSNTGSHRTWLRLCRRQLVWGVGIKLGRCATGIKRQALARSRANGQRHDAIWYPSRRSRPRVCIDGRK
jgi:hypothetical protein